MSLPGALAPVVLGVALGASFNPLAAVVGSSAAAAIDGSPNAPADRRIFAWGLLTLAWALGDGLRVVWRVREAVSAGAVTWDRGAPLALWTLVGFACYLLPAMAGAFVGRRVTHGTGWLSAIVIAGALSMALSASAGPLVTMVRSLLAV